MLNLPINNGFTLTEEITKKFFSGQLQLVAIKDPISGTSSMYIHNRGNRILLKHDHGSMTIAFKTEYLFQQYNECEELCNDFKTENIEIDSLRQFSKQETSQVHSVLLLLSHMHQHLEHEIERH